MIEDLVFCMSVDAGEGVVENQDSGMADEGAGDCGALFLSAGERDAALANQSFVFVRKLFDFCGDVGGFCGPMDIFIAGIFYPEGNVFADGLAEEKRFLGHEAGVSA